MRRLRPVLDHGMGLRNPKQRDENNNLTGVRGDDFVVETALHCKRYLSSRGGLVFIHTIVRSVRNLVLLLLVLISLTATFQTAGIAQDAVDRKVKSKVSPAYPEIARKMGLTGTVKLQLVVAPNGTVKETKVIGGHPILVNAAVDAVKKWRFETAGAESTGTVEFRFDPGN